MTKKAPESSSAFVVVSRKTLIISMIGIAVLSFASGYFWGYEGSPSDKLVRSVDADSKKAFSEEKTVLDSAGKPAVIDHMATPDSIPKELIPRPAGQNMTAQTPAEPLRNPGPPVNTQDEKKDLKKDAIRAEKKIEFAMAQNKQIDIDKVSDKAPNADSPTEAKQQKAKKEQVAEIHKKGAAKKARTVTKKKSEKKMKGKSKQKNAEIKHANKLYSVQVGSFLDRQKAIRLKDDLNGKGYTAHIVTSSPASGKVFSRVRIGAYRIKADAEEIVPKLTVMGLSCVIVPAQR
jgi:cell division protein FtsN